MVTETVENVHKLLARLVYEAAQRNGGHCDAKLVPAGEDRIALVIDGEVAAEVTVVDDRRA
jgi:hypothetical protein